MGFCFFAQNKFISVNYLSVESISKSYGERVLFEDISFGISKDQKVDWFGREKNKRIYSKSKLFWRVSSQYKSTTKAEGWKKYYS